MEWHGIAWDGVTWSGMGRHSMDGVIWGGMDKMAFLQFGSLDGEFM